MPTIHELHGRYFQVSPRASSMVELSRLVRDDLPMEFETTGALDA